MRLLFLILVSGLLSACTTFPTEKIMKVHQGMSSTEILEMFGNPKNVSQAVCGGNTGLQWTCTTWQYGYSDFGDSASFTFSGEPGNLVLNNFSFNRK